jgi:NADPH-dependent glutamate synthase beta subunit-like oxidoreductase
MDQIELREQENRCIQEQPPGCTTGCPVHVDVRTMAAEISNGDFVAAFKTYRKTIPFPRIISHICVQSCQSQCKRQSIGGVIEIAALERAVVEFGSPFVEPYKALPRKTKTVAVVGGGISGLTVAYDLARKGWGVVVYESSDRLGGGLWEISPSLLPPDDLEKDLAILEPLGVETKFKSAIAFGDDSTAGTSLTELTDTFDAVYLAIGPSANASPAVALTKDGHVLVDALTYQTNLPKVFAGGDMLRAQVGSPERSNSAILALSEGRRAAVSIDRFLQNVSMTASRTNEGSYETRLYTNLEPFETVTSSIKTDLTTQYKQGNAQEEASRCIQCECLVCVKNCEYLTSYKGYPKKYIREVYNNLSIVMGARFSNNFINSCSLCGQCGEVCPTDVDFGEVCHNARETMVEQKRMPPSAHDFALQDMAFSNTPDGKFALARNAPGKNSSDYAFFPGCQLSASSPAYIEKAYDFLQGAYPDAGVGLMLRCCGAPADWGGRKDLLEETRMDFMLEYEKLGKPKMIMACSSCYQVFQKYYPEVEIVSYWEVFDKLGPQDLSKGRVFTAPVAIHDPCSTRNEKAIQDSVRNILKKLGCEVEELAMSREKTECCSFGGHMWLANKPLAEKAVQRRVNESTQDYLTYCAMCRDFFARRGKRTVHLFDSIYGDELLGNDLALAPAVGFSQRHENRARLKEKLLKSLWSESMPEQAAYEHIRLVLPTDVQKMIEDRLILVEDMQKVLEHVERTGKRMLNANTQHFLAYYKPTSVTYWVEYSHQDDGSYLIHKAYSHRMEIGVGAQK